MVDAMTARDHRPEPRPAPESATAQFGDRVVPEADKMPLVRGVFESVAERYDLMNDLMSGGVHRLWKAAMIDWLNPRPGQSLLDVAGGTGDVVQRVIERVGAARVGPILVCDLTPAMLTAGRDRMIDRGFLGDATAGGVHWICGDAEALPLADRSVEAYTIAFGLRNVTHIDRALTEARRVLKPGGRFLCLGGDRRRRCLSLLGGVYPALESIRRFPPQDELAARIAAAGLERVRYRNLTGGIAALHSAWRL
jgi:demethylmenaquinone methyltransferase/2-methoxy-6-polyprenyl-1,4-benzoquinol methylase